MGSLSLLLLVIVSQLTYINCKSTCTDPWFTIPETPGTVTPTPDIQCFRVLGRRPQDWTSARVFCSTIAGGGKGGDLAHPRNLAALTDYLARKQYEDGNYWLGGSDLYEEGVWYWNDGYPITPTPGGDWGPNQPDGGENKPENCLAVLLKAGKNQLYDKQCALKHNVICEKTYDP